MADHNITVSNSLNVFGPAPTFWDNAEWGTDYWGEGSQSISLAILKTIENSQSIDDALTLSVGYNRTLSESFSVDSEPIEETLQDRAGYYYVFRRPSIDAEDRTLTTFTADARPSSTWSRVVASAVSWSSST